MSKWVAVLPEGGEAAKDPKYLCCVENALDLREFAKEKKADLFVTADKEGPDSGMQLATMETASHNMSFLS